VAFEGISFNTAKLTYHYRLNTIDTSWRSTTDTVLNFVSLPPGDYQFEILAMNSEGIKSKISSFKFKIANPFYLTPLFYITASILAIIIIAMLIKLIADRQIKKHKEKALIKQKLSDLEMKALRTQMNPHFIFNSLNSIQHFILGRDEESANNYLTKFAKLMRSVLNHCGKN
jgi:hypothetical protein